MKVIKHTENFSLLRRKEYPTIEEFADAMYWASKGDDAKLKEYYQKCENVKKKFPKNR